MDRRFNEQIKSISMAILDCRAVPFIGAGVSRNAVYEGCTSEKRLIHYTEEMTRRVCRSIVKEYSKKDNGTCMSILRRSKYTCHRYKKSSKKQKLGLAEACEYFASINGSFAKLVHRVLKIPKFRKLLPTQAHRYIAFLAREGLIEEVFTTNYDCCMERAYKQSFPGEPEASVNQIHDGRTYRQQVGRRPWFRWQTREYPRLTVYKLNGCANAITIGAKIDTILLTERQLQDWRERQWARDVFRDRLRSRSIIFSGFGSPEPQIRHTVVQILEEMSSGTSDNASGGEVRAPYVVCYDPVKEPTFHQWQIANAFCQSDGNTNGLSVNDLLVIPLDNKCFSADQFWENIYHQVVVELIKSLLMPRTETADRIKVLLGGNEQVLEEVASKVAKLDDSSYGNVDFLKWSEKHETTLLARWLYLTEGAGSPLDQKGVYMAIRDHRVLVGDFLLVWGAFISEDTSYAKSNSFEEDPEIGVRIKLDEQGRILYLTGAGRCDEHHFCPGIGNSAKKCALLILGPMRPGIKHALVRPRREHSAKERILDDIILVRLYLSEVLRGIEHPPQSLRELKELLERIALTPTVFFRKEQDSLHNRLNPISDSGGRS